jgi:hypothetical protein
MTNAIDAFMLDMSLQGAASADWPGGRGKLAAFGPRALIRDINLDQSRPVTARRSVADQQLRR